jgi:hypothetical protein
MIYLPVSYTFNIYFFGLPTWSENVSGKRRRNILHSLREIIQPAMSDSVFTKGRLKIELTLPGAIPLGGGGGIIPASFTNFKRKRKVYFSFLQFLTSTHKSEFHWNTFPLYLSEI